MSKQNGILDLVVKGVWFDKIKSGEKTHEYRLANDYWHTRINNLVRPAKVRFRRGYAKNADTMLFDIKSIEIVDGLQTDLRIHDDVFDIELGERVKPRFSDGQEVFVVFFRRIWLVRDCTILSHKQQGDCFREIFVARTFFPGRPAVSNETRSRRRSEVAERNSEKSAVLKKGISYDLFFLDGNRRK